MSLEAQERAAKSAAKKAAKAEAQEAQEASKRATSRITIKRVERSKRKYVTAVQGLEAFGLDMKKVSKDFGKKFATGSSVTKAPGGGEEITVQGDLSCEIEDYIVDTYKDVPGTISTWWKTRKRRPGEIKLWDRSGPHDRLLKNVPAREISECIVPVGLR